MKLIQLNGKNHLGLNIFVLGVTVLLIGSLITPSFTALGNEGEDNGEKVEVPKWYEGDRWVYTEKIPMPDVELPMPDMEEIKFEMEVINADFPARIGTERGEKRYDTYQVEETIGLDREEEEQARIRFHYTHEHLAELYNDPINIDMLPSAYVPPVREMDFPLYVGKEWDGEETGYYLDPMEDEGSSEPDKRYWYRGKVEETVTKEVEVRGVREEFETYMVNLTIVGQGLEGDESDITIKRYEIYYSPEVRNIVNKEMFETRKPPEEELDPGDDVPVIENSIGNETLVDYELQDPPEDDGDGEVSLMGVGVVLLIIGVGTASFIVYKKVKSSW